MPLALAASNSGAVSADGISRSKKLSSSAGSVMYQRGKNVVSASSGKTTRSQPLPAASSSRASMRRITSARESARWMGPSWAAARVRMRLMWWLPRAPRRRCGRRSGRRWRRRWRPRSRCRRRVNAGLRQSASRMAASPAAAAKPAMEAAPDSPLTMPRAASSRIMSATASSVMVMKASLPGARSCQASIDGSPQARPAMMVSRSPGKVTRRSSLGAGEEAGGPVGLDHDEDRALAAAQLPEPRQHAGRQATDAAGHEDVGDVRRGVEDLGRQHRVALHDVAGHVGVAWPGGVGDDLPAFPLGHDRRVADGVVIGAGHDARPRRRSRRWRRCRPWLTVSWTKMTAFAPTRRAPQATARP